MVGQRATVLRNFGMLQWEIISTVSGPQNGSSLHISDFNCWIQLYRTELLPML